MAGQSGIDEIVNLFMRGVDSVHFPSEIREGLADVIRNSESSDNIVDDIIDWRNGVLKQGDLSSQAREFLESPTTIIRMKSIPKIQEVALDFTKAIESNSDKVNINKYIDELSNSTALSSGDIEAIRSSFDELLTAREDAIKKVMTENPEAARQDVLDQWAKQFDSADSRSSHLGARAFKSQRVDDADLLRRIDELEKRGDFSGTDKLYVKFKKRLGIMTAGALGVAVADASLESPLSEALGRVSQKDIPVISAVTDALSGTLALAVDGVSYVMSAPAKFMASTVIGGLEENGKIAQGEEGDNQRALVMLISHVVSGNALPAAEIAFGLDISAQDINDAVARAKAKDLSATEVVQSVYLDLKDNVLSNAKENKYGLAGGAFDSARKSVDRKKEELTQSANMLLNNKISGGGLSAMSSGVSGLFSNNVSSVFNAASDNIERLGVTGASKIAFQFISTVASIVGIFSKEAKESIQNFALSAFGIDRKINDLREAISNNRVVSQFGDKFGMGANKPHAPELAAEL